MTRFISQAGVACQRVRKSFTLKSFCFACTLLAATFTQAQTVAPAADVKATIESVQNIVRTEQGKSSDDVVDQKLKDIIMPMFNFEEMAKRSLGVAWNKATEAERKEFVELFSDLLARTYLKKIKQNAQESVLLQISDSIDGDKAKVKSKIKSGEDEIQIDYVMGQIAGKWRVYDVIIENVGLVNNYRNEFPGIVRNEGFAGLIKRLKEKQQKKQA